MGSTGDSAGGASGRYDRMVEEGREPKRKRRRRYRHVRPRPGSSTAGSGPFRTRSAR